MPRTGSGRPAAPSCGSPRRTTFSHREELVYLPPVWFSSNPPPRLPAVMMMGAELSRPRTGFTVRPRAVHPGRLRPAASGRHTGRGVPRHHRLVHQRHTEVRQRRPRGNAADHLVKEFVPYVISPWRQRRCRQLGPGRLCGRQARARSCRRLPIPNGSSATVTTSTANSARNEEQTIARLFGGDADARGLRSGGPSWRLTVATTDWPPGSGVDRVQTVHRGPGDGSAPVGVPEGRDSYSEDHNKTANQLCEPLSAYGAELGRRVCRRPRPPFRAKRSGMPYPGWQDAWGARSSQGCRYPA